jgi:hypothetical protein
MGEILAAGYGTEEDAARYMEVQARDTLIRLQSIVAKAEKIRSWKFMEGCYSQAMTLYVVASIIYEKHPEYVLMSDIAFDRLARFLLKHWDELSEDFRNWYTISAIDLEASTGYNVTDDMHVRWVVAIHTNTEVNNDGRRGAPETPLDGPRVLRRKAKRGSKLRTSKVRKRVGQSVLKAKRIKRGRPSSTD